MNSEQVKAWATILLGAACVGVGLVRDEIPLVNAGLGVLAGPQLLSFALRRGGTTVEVGKQA